MSSHGGKGIVPPAGDIGGTAADPTVVSTHLTASLPQAQGGTGQTSVNAGLTAPLTLPVASGSPLKTAGGNTLDDSFGDMAVIGNLGANKNITLSQRTTMTSGTGAPGIAGALGDLYFRTDTPSTADQRIYICTTAGAAGAAVWTAIL